MKSLMNNTFLFMLAILTVFACENQKENNTNELTDKDSTALDNRYVIYSDTLEKDVVTLKSTSNSTLRGKASLKEVNNGRVQLRVSLEGVAPGKHAVHIHEYGDCSAADGSSAGGHWNPTNVDHGQRNVSDEYHAGDIGNIEIGADSTGTLVVNVPKWELGGDSDWNVLGKAIIVHAGADDFSSQPSGSAGKRIGCGVL